jgi:hypothetical protein
MAIPSWLFELCEMGPDRFSPYRTPAFRGTAKDKDGGRERAMLND